MQAGMLSIDQVLGHGLSRAILNRLLESGGWRRVSSGLVHVLPSPPTWEGLAWGGTLVGGPLSRLGPEASAYLYGLQLRAPLPIDVLVPYENPVRVRGPWRFQRELPGVRPGRSPGSPPRLTPECTVLDLAARRGSGDVVGIVTDAVQRGLTTPERLQGLLESRPRQRHRQLISGLLADVASGVESPLEVMYLRTVERPHHLPKGHRQGSPSGLPYQRDVDYEDFGLLVELDGKRGHQGEGRFRDMNRDNRHALRDELTLRFGYFDVASRPCPVAFQVYLALVKRGYLEPFVRCRRCVNVPEADLLAA
jgi:hypothetical protein